MTDLEDRTKKFESITGNKEEARRWTRISIAWPDEMVDQVIAYRRLDKAYAEAIDLCLEMYEKRIFRVAGVERTQNMTLHEWAERVFRETAPKDIKQYLDDYLEFARRVPPK